MHKAVLLALGSIWSLAMGLYILRARPSSLPPGRLFTPSGGYWFLIFAAGWSVNAAEAFSRAVAPQSYHPGAHNPFLWAYVAVGTITLCGIAWHSRKGRDKRAV